MPELKTLYHEDEQWSREIEEMELRQHSSAPGPHGKLSGGVVVEEKSLDFFLILSQKSRWYGVHKSRDTRKDD